MTSKSSKWEKLPALLLAACMVISLAGCNGEDQSSSDSSDTSDTGEEIVYHKVGYIFAGKVEDGTTTGEMNEQRIKASNRSSVDTCYIDGVTISDFETAVKQLASAGCTDIVAASHIYANIMTSVSAKYMNLNFIGYGASGSGANVTVYTEEIYQGAYAAGMVAAQNSNSQKIGFVADIELMYAIQSVNAAALGTQLVYTNPTLYAASATRDNEIAEAVDALLEKGCDVIIGYTNSSYTEEYCQKKGVKFIANHDYSGVSEKYSKMLMYYYPKRDSFFLSQFKQMKMDTWEPSVYSGNIGNGVINVSEALSAAKDGTQETRDALIPKLSSDGENIFKGELMDNTGVVKYMQGVKMTEREINNMDWYVRGVEVVGNFREPQTNLPTNNFEIKE